MASGDEEGSASPVTAAAGASGGTARAEAPSIDDAPGMASRAALIRLRQDLRGMLEDPPAGVSAGPLVESNLFQWQATIVGPDETPWEGGMFRLRLTFPDEYPMKPPKARFTCDMWHPNVYPDGTLCLDILQENWKPVYSVGTILSSIQSLLEDPNTDSPANVECSDMYLKNKKEYKRRVRRCAARTLDD